MPDSDANYNYNCITCTVVCIGIITATTVAGTATQATYTAAATTRTAAPATLIATTLTVTVTTADTATRATITAAAAVAAPPTNAIILAVPAAMKAALQAIPVTTNSSSGDSIRGTSQASGNDMYNTCNFCYTDSNTNYWAQLH